MVESLFLNLSLVVVITVSIAWMMRLLRQPLIVGYILAGVVVGAIHGTGTSALEGLAQFGVVLLLFMVGLGLDPKVAREVGTVSVVAGMGQLLFTSIIGFGLALALGFNRVSSAYIAIALTLSSTIVVVKLLSDRGDTHALYGRIAIGFLLVQDIVAMLLLMVIGSLTPGASLGIVALAIAGKGVLLVALLMGVSAVVLPPLVRSAARSSEFLLLFSLGWCLAVASAFWLLGFSVEVGALLAGVALSLSPFRHEINSRLVPLRDFFVALFFILVGSQMSLAVVQAHVTHVILLSLFILLGNPLVVMALLGAMGYTRRTGFFAGLTVAQVSEFSLILIALGIKVGHLSEEILSLVTFVGLVTIAGSSYFIIHADRLYERFSHLLRIFERAGRRVDDQEFNLDRKFDAVLIGCSRLGQDLLPALRSLRAQVLVVDHDPEIVQELGKTGVPCKYGDAADVEMLSELPLGQVRILVSSVPDYETSELLLAVFRKANPSGVAVVRGQDVNGALNLYAKGADYVILPRLLGSRHAALLIQNLGLLPERYRREKESQLVFLNERKRKGFLRHEYYSGVY